MKHYSSERDAHINGGLLSKCGLIENKDSLVLEEGSYLVVGDIIGRT